ncbi:MAG: hypothetical protein KAH84_08910 [Thiomargarita sp.]|nr:hypothetical protein [Thiomargarita sp.]
MWLFIFVFGLASLWDGFTTVYGTTEILGGGSPQILGASAIFSLIILAFLLNTNMIWKMAYDELLGGLLKIMWFVALGYDLYTSYIGNQYFILEGHGNNTQLFILLGITLLVTGSPIFLSLLWDNK